MYSTSLGPIAVVFVIAVVIATVLGLFAGNIFGPVPEANAYKTMAEADDYIKDEEAARIYEQQANKIKLENLPLDLEAERQRKQIEVETWQYIGIILAFSFAASVMIVATTWAVIRWRRVEAEIADRGIPPPGNNGTRIEHSHVRQYQSIQNCDPSGTTNTHPWRGPERKNGDLTGRNIETITDKTRNK